LFAAVLQPEVRVSTVVLKDLGPGSTDRDADRGRNGWSASTRFAN